MDKEQGTVGASRQAFFDHHARQWDELCGPDEVVRLSRLVEYLPLESAQDVLDVGCGTGVLWPLLRPRLGDHGMIVAIDLSFQMLREGRRRGDGEILAMQADAHSLPFASGIFGLVTCFATFPHLSDQALGMREMGRVLRDGGEVWILHLMSSNEIARHHGDAGTAVAHDVLPSREGMRSMMESAGIECLDIVDEPGRYTAVGRKRREDRS